MKGLVTITKIYKDGTREPVCINKPNTLTHGFSSSLVKLMTVGSDNILSDFKFSYFQVGTSSYYDTAHWEDALPDSTRRNFLQLHSPVSSVDDYGLNSNIEIVEREIITLQEQFVPTENLQYSSEKNYLGVLNEDGVYMVEDSKGIAIKINLDNGALVGKDLREFGLFLRNPDINLDDDAPILACYQSLTDPISKTDDFSVEIQWVIQFATVMKTAEELASVIRFHPTIKRKFKDYISSNYTKYIKSNETHDVIIETDVPTTEDAYLHYIQVSSVDPGNRYENAVSGVHWTIVDASGNETSAYNSPIFWPKGSTQVKFTVSALDPGYFYAQRPLVFELSSYTGKGKTLANQYENSFPNRTALLIRSSRQAPSFDLSTATVTGVGVLSGAVSADSPADRIQVFLDVSTDGTSYVFNGTEYSADRRFHRIILNYPDTTKIYTVSGSLGDTIKVTSYNTPSGEPVYNNSTYSEDFRDFYQPGLKEGITYIDLSSNRDDISIKGGEGPWTKANAQGGTEAFLEGYPTGRVYSGFDIYNTQPPSDVLMRDLFLSSNPDSIGSAQFLYSPQELYTWPVNSSRYYVNNCGKVRPGQADITVDGAGNTLGGDLEAQVSRYHSDMSSVVFSCYVKKVDDVLTDTNRSHSPSITGNKVFAGNITTRGYPGIGFYGSQKGKSAYFEWNDAGGIDVIKVRAESDGTFSFSNDNCLQVQYVSATGHSTFMDSSDVGLPLSSSQYGILGTIAGDTIGSFSGNNSSENVASGYINVTSSLTHSYTFPFASTTGHTLIAVGGSLNLSSQEAPEQNEGLYGFVCSGVGAKYDAGVFSGTNGGDTTASRDLAAYGYTDPFCKDGWYRVWIAADVSEDLYETSIYASASDGSGAIHTRNWAPSVQKETNTFGLVGLTPPDPRNGQRGSEGFGDYEVPSVASGILMAWDQYEVYEKTTPFTKGHTNGYMPRPYQARPFSWFTPKGSAFVDNLGVSSTTFNF